MDREWRKLAKDALEKIQVLKSQRVANPQDSYDEKLNMVIEEEIEELGARADVIISITNREEL